MAGTILISEYQACPEKGGRMFGKKREKVRRLDYNPQEKVPVIHCSICNGEQVGGLKDLRTGSFEEVMLIRDEKDRAAFQTMVGTEDIVKEY